MDRVLHKESSSRDEHMPHLSFGDLGRSETLGGTVGSLGSLLSVPPRVSVDSQTEDLPH